MMPSIYVYISLRVYTIIRYILSHFSLILNKHSFIESLLKLVVGPSAKSAISLPSSLERSLNFPVLKGTWRSPRSLVME